MEVYRGEKITRKGTRCYDLENVLILGRKLFRTDRAVTKVIFTQEKKNWKVILKKNLLRKRYP